MLSLSLSHSSLILLSLSPLFSSLPLSLSLILLSPSLSISLSAPLSPSLSLYVPLSLSPSLSISKVPREAPICVWIIKWPLSATFTSQSLASSHTTARKMRQEPFLWPPLVPDAEASCNVSFWALSTFVQQAPCCEAQQLSINGNLPESDSSAITSSKDGALSTCISIKGI